MKTFILIILTTVLFTGALCAQDFPVTGKWRLQVIGSPTEIPLEINDTTWTFEVNGNPIPQNVTIQSNEKTVIIPLFVGLADYYFYEIKDGYIDLKAGGKFNIPLLDSIRRGMAGMENINDVTDDFINHILVEMEAAFYKVPIMRLYRNK